MECDMKQQQQYRIVLLITCMMTLLVSVMSGSAVAREVYTWTDANGVVHYSDKPPDGEKAQTVNIWGTRRSGSTRAEPDPGDTQPDAASDAVVKDDTGGQESTTPQSLADAKREQIARDREERRETQAEMDRMCAKHGERLASVEPHRRVFYTDESGETVRMDDDKRIALVEESRDFLAKNCD